VKISVEPVQAFAFSVTDGEAEGSETPAVRVEWQAKPGGKREHVNITMESSVPADMLRAAAAYFASQEIPF
jgi:hypothetical protein